MYVLGLDVSTSCTGYCLMYVEPSQRTSVKEIGYILISKDKDPYVKAQKVRSLLSNLSEKYQIDKVFIEENLQAFRTGFSSAKTLVTLARFNGVVSYICQEVLETEPKFLNVNSARKDLGLKIKRKKDGGAPTKEQVLAWVKNEDRTITWPNKILKSGPNKGKEIIHPSAYDMADAYVICQAGILNI